jgi:heme o synthase
VEAELTTVAVKEAALAPAAARLPVARDGLLRLAAALFKLRIAFSIVLSAVAGALVAQGAWPAGLDVVVLSLGVLLAAGGAGACNHYFERDIDTLMRRTRGRPFVTGQLRQAPGWLLLFGAMMLGGSALVALRFGAASGALVLAGALTYAVIYTLWLKRRTHWNIVIGGAAGSFAVLAGAAAFDAPTAPAVLLLAAVLFLWTPSHFWALAIAIADDYRRAGVPMLPVTHGRALAARWTFVNSLLLVASSLALAALLQHWLIWLGAAAGGSWLLWTGWRMLRRPDCLPLAMSAFRASLVQLGLLLLSLFLAYGFA